MKDLSNKIAKAKDRVMEDMYGLITKYDAYWAWTDEEKAQLRRMAFLLSLPDDEETTLAALSVNYASDSEEVETPKPPGMGERYWRNVNKE